MLVGIYPGNHQMVPAACCFLMPVLVLLLLLDSKFQGTISWLTTPCKYFVPVPNLLGYLRAWVFNAYLPYTVAGCLSPTGVDGR
jgi:hypothetical protein